MTMIQLWRHPPDEYLTLIGHFIVSMSHGETYFKQLLWKSSGVGHELGQLITGGAPVDNIAWIMKKLYDKNCVNQLQVDDIESIVGELALLKKARDEIAHRQWNDSVGGVVLSHKALAKTAELIEETPFTVGKLESLCVRAHILNGRILRHLVQKEAIDFIERNWHGDYKLPDAPWTYKSTPRIQPAEKVRKTHTSSRKPPRPRGSRR